ncbi:hypothetical protein [Leeuwenhoekiella aequorea]|uniref:Uncharacterized protein n=1 Tax=Leeuwenhoekiella aequorea TaxID=283736 RepID=A0A4Q0P3N9_9FLAO|nr:hypothetical protein [Leeuwenhoekiella aequorea]RXG20668.1 hypothetical protein DSM00_2772 [Leeuwenhoekiella aequorea]
MNKILAFSITIILFGIHKISAQNYLNYYETINKAEIENLDGNFKKSDSLYRIAFKLVEKPFKDDLLLASINSENLNDNQKTYEYLKKGISVGLTKKRIRKELSEFKKSVKWKPLKKEYDLIRENYLKSLNLTLRNELLKMVEEDQSARHPIFGSWKKMKKTDTYNHNHLLEIIKENIGKWPGRINIGDGNEDGKYAYGEITIMLHHFSTEQVMNLKPILIEAILNGNLSPYNIAYPLDYKNLKTIAKRKRGNTIFVETCNIIGSYLGSKSKEAIICDCETAEKERKRIGLEPLKDYFRKRNSNYKCYEQK